MFSTAFTYMAVSGVFDPDAEAFFSAAGITDATQKDAVNQLVLDLKAQNLWSSFYALYPIVGTTSSQQSYNLINPATYQITWNGGWTHSANGALGNASNTYGNTGILARTSGVSNTSYSLGVYNRVNGLVDSIDFGAIDDPLGISPRITFYSNFGNTAFFDAGAGTDPSPRLRIFNTKTNGFWIATRTSATAYGIFVDGSALGTVTNGVNPVEGRPNIAFTLGALNGNGTPVLPSGNQYALCFWADGFTSAQISTLNTIVQTFQTTLGRNV